MTIDELRKKRIGLVLSGGGAKGAYQIGCWRALRSRGIEKFAAISGASVGALNAMFVATGKWAEALDLWARLKFWKILLPRWGLLVLPIWIPFAAYRAIAVPIRGRDPIKRALTFIMMLWALVMWLYVTTEGAAHGFYLGISVVCLFDNIGTVIRWVLLVCTSATNRPLKNRLSSTFSDSDLRSFEPRVYLTLARWRPELRASEDWNGWLPQYVTANGLNRDDILGVLLQSAGLPGIFPIRSTLGSSAVDGGFCDNVPIAPLLFDKRVELDIVIVVFLNDEDRRPSPLRLLKFGNRGITWTKQSTGLYDIALTARDNWASHELGEGIGGYTEARPIPRVIPIVPSEQLGKFFDGTLRFTSRYARKLIDQGWHDTNRILDQLALEDDLSDAYFQSIVNHCGNLLKREWNEKEAYWLRGHALYNLCQTKAALDDFVDYGHVDRYGGAAVATRIWTLRTWLGDSVHANGELRAMNESTRRSSWSVGTCRLVEFLLGKISEAEYLATEGGNGATAHFYVGMKDFLAGKHVSARTHFEVAMSTGSSGDEDFMSAKVFLRHVP